MVQDLNALHAGLTERLGEHAFATRVNAMRRDALSSGRGSVFAESSFHLGKSFSHGWSMNVGDAVGTVGFGASPTLEAIVIAPYDGNLEAVWQNPLAVLRDARGFVLPRDDADLLEMAPGSSVAVRGQGNLGFNLGIGLPITVGTIADYVILSARISAGARVSMSGVMDVQLVRGEGNEVFVDVGLSKHRVSHFSLAVNTGWGIEGLPVINLDLGPMHVDLTKIAETALENQLNQRLAVFSANASTGSQEGRLTVARFSFELGKGDAVVSQAVAQALRGDLRLAQALANRPESGVVQHLDLAKEFRSESDYLGFRFLSLRYFKATGHETGRVSVDADGEHQTLLFDELRRETGRFLTEHQTVWRQVTSLVASKGQLTDASVNARLTLRERDVYMCKDQILDHVDSLVAYFMGFDATFNELGPVTDQLVRYSDYACRRPRTDDDDGGDRAEKYETCVAEIPQTDEYQSLWGQAMRGYAELANRTRLQGFRPELSSVAEIARRLIEMKTGISGVHEPHDVALLGPRGTILAQFRLSHSALEQMMSEEGAGRFRSAIDGVISLMRAKRRADVHDKERDVVRNLQRRDEAINHAVEVFANAADEYRHYKRVTELRFGDRPLGDHASLMLVPVHNPDDVVLATLAEHKGKVVQKLLQTLDELPSRYGAPAGYVFTYAMLWLTQPHQVEFLADFRFDDRPGENYGDWATQLYSRGTDPFIGAGMFNLDELLGAR